jgi:beta-phosphoglucomutase family hydrolase
MTSYSAFLFDLNGTMIDDMHYHVQAWHRILNDLGANISLERMKQECYGKNDELLERMFPGRFSTEEKQRMSRAKEEAYQAAFLPQLKLLPGLHELLGLARANGIRMAIGSAAIMFNIDFVLDNLNIRPYFDVLVSADDVQHSKPHPETYLQCAQRLGVEPAQCLVFEDAPKGVESAARAGMDAWVITGMHTPGEFAAFSNIVGMSHDFVPVTQKLFVAT